jgi:hypothetical protein
VGVTWSRYLTRCRYGRSSVLAVPIRRASIVVVQMGFVDSVDGLFLILSTVRER